MCKRWLWIVLLLVPLSVRGQDDWLRAALELTGGAEEEALDEQALARFDHYRNHPVRINRLPRSRLLATGLFSVYQVATLLDYRQHEGDVLSVTELARIDGFGIRNARALAPFLSFASDRLPGQTEEDDRLQAGATFRATKGSAGWQGSGKALVEGRRWEAGLAGKAVPGDRPALTSGFAAFQGRRLPLTVIAGDFQARFGQGLALWSGFSLSGIPTVTALYKRPAGLSPVRSYGGSGYRGLAADLSLGRWTLSAFAAARSGLLSGGNLSWYGKYGQVSVTAFHDPAGSSKWAADGRFCLGGTECFAEVARDRAASCTAVVGGLVFPWGESRLGLVRRHYPADYAPEHAGAIRSGTKVRDEEGLTLAFGNALLDLSLDAAYHPSRREGQLKGVFSGTLQRGAWTWKWRLAERYRSAAPRNRTDVRADLGWTRGAWTLNARLNAVRSKRTGWLAYAESGWQQGNWLAWLRGTLFRVDDWEDRVYAYERNAPGSFSVPAYYGRGFGVSCYAGRKGKHWKAWLQASLLAYPWMETKKPGKAGLRLQVTMDW